MGWAAESIAEMMAARREGRESVLSVDTAPIHFGLGALSELDRVFRSLAVGVRIADLACGDSRSLVGTVAWTASLRPGNSRHRKRRP
ncbi:hypothetical protein [Mesorhizobium sp.]|uniref:hypothetical protein n=1 Tax=Mesorhizobium sp. TaxID=1871066 RepID=UPI000FE6D46E|nr:hypothetical protein [Mesorhizobium sp.]RWC27914.1 MAG: hypothetical protein EOS27_20135 [Mesorhizobium sp.]TIX27691.1 MAG: hypothetical protein E5V35_05300 [Mesorhizobium sp.]